MIDKNRLKQLVCHEVESYRFLKPTFFRLLLLLAALVASISTSTFILISMFQPLVFIRGSVLNGVVRLVTYEIDFLGRAVRFPPLDSLRLITLLLLIMNVNVLALSIMCVYGLLVRYRAWLSLVPVASSLSALSVSLMFSLLRVYAFDVVPAITRSVAVSSPYGVFVLEQPEVEHTWLSLLPRKPIYFLVCFNVLLFLTVATLLLFLYTPHPPVLVRRRFLVRFKGRSGDEKRR